MRVINVIFEDKEHKELEKIKESLSMNWHDFILKIARRYINNEKTEVQVTDDRRKVD